MNEKYFSDCKNANDLLTRYEEIVRVFNLGSMPDGQFKNEVESMIGRAGYHLPNYS